MTARDLALSISALVLAASIWISASAPAQSPRRVGVLLLTTDCPPPTPLVESLAGLGWVEGKTIVFDCVSAADRLPELSALAAALVARRPDVIVSGYISGVRALKASTATIPIVMLNVADPVRMGVVESLSHPGGNVTGLASVLSELDGKRIELLREAVPKLARLAVIYRQGGDPGYRDAIEEMLVRVGGTYGFSHEWFYAARTDELPPVFAEIASGSFDAIYLAPTPVADTHVALVGRLAQASGLPTIGYSAMQAEAGVLLSYGHNDKYRAGRVASYVDKILKGAKPADLPIEQPTEFELVINLKTAKVLGITIPPSILARADEVIE